MEISSVDVIAAVVAIVAIVKIIVVIINRKAWCDKVVEPIYNNSSLSSSIFLILGIVAFYYLLQEISIVQIFAVIGLSACLIAVGLLQYSNEFIFMLKKVCKRKFGRWLWFYIVVWVVLSVWVLYEIFFR